MPAQLQPRIRIGTSGWRHRHWRGQFYPEHLRPREWLAHYAARFECVEIDASLPRGLPEPEVLAGWRESTPAGFRFAVRAPRAITHQKKLKNCENELQRLLARVGLLGDRLGPVLFRLPARWRLNLPRLRVFLDALPRGGRYAFELRDASWHVEPVMEALQARGAGFCVFTEHGAASPVAATGELAYLRLGAPREGLAGSYRIERLRRWAGDLLGWRRAGCETYAFLDNDARAWALHNAQRLRALVDEGAGGRAGAAPRTAMGAAS